MNIIFIKQRDILTMDGTVLLIMPVSVVYLGYLHVGHTSLPVLKLGLHSEL